MKQLIVTIVLVCFLSSCNPSNNTLYSSIDELIENPDTSFVALGNTLFIIKNEGDTREIEEDRFRLIIAEKKENKLKKIKDTVFLESYDNTLIDIAAVTLNNKNYLYYVAHMEGGSMGNKDVFFVLLDYSKNEEFVIQYIELPEGGITTIRFDKSPNLLHNKTLLNFLENKISESNQIYRPNTKDLLVEQFLNENKQFLKKMIRSTSQNKPFQLHKVSTKKKLFDIQKIKTNDDTISTFVAVAENDRYIVTSIFKGPTLGYQKATTEYFIIWATETLSSWVRTLMFDRQGNLIFCTSDCYHVILDNMIYTSIEKNELNY